MKNVPDYAKYPVTQGNSGKSVGPSPEDQKAHMGRDIRSNCEVFPGHYIDEELSHKEK